jgi:ketosteroid isomerase-like protein
MEFAGLIQRMTTAAAAGDGGGVADCFTDDGVYHDVFYGSFRGRDGIVDMIENHFHRDGEDFRWDVHDPVDDGALAYARYVFSYRSKLAGSAGKRALFEGVCIVRMTDGLIADYREVAEVGTGLAMMEFAPERIAKFFARQARDLASRAEATGHVDE